MAFMFIRIKEIMLSVVQKLCVYCEVGCDVLSVSYMHFRIKNLNDNCTHNSMLNAVC